MSKSILFVCTGNVARSQMAEVFYNHLTQSKDAASAGTEVTLGKPLHPDVIATFERHFLPHTGLIRKQITKEMVDNADKIIVMTQESLPAYLVDNPKVAHWDIDDPRGKGIEAHEATYQALREKIQFLRKQNG